MKPEDLKTLADVVRAVLRAASVGYINTESASLAESYFDVLMTHFDQQRAQLDSLKNGAISRAEPGVMAL